MKSCGKCKIEKESSDFSKSWREKDGLQGRCKECCCEYQRAYQQTEAGKETSQRAGCKRRRLHPEKIKARHAVSNAIRDGKLTRPSICESCSGGGFIESHHEDYSKQLDVRWLCKKCHKELCREEKI